MGVARLGRGAISANHRVRLSMDIGEDTMKKRRHALKPRRIKRKKGIVSRVISGSAKAVTKAWN